MKILITGSNGLLGQKIISLLLNDGSFFFGENPVEIFGCSRGENRLENSESYHYISLDLTDKNRVEAVLMKVSPDCVIHTAAMTNVDECELNPMECVRQNVEATRNLVESLLKLDKEEKKRTHFIHLSTDFIFDGQNGPYRENDAPGPLSIYGQSKLDAEKIVIESGLNFAIVRTIIVYGVTHGMSRSNLVLWVAESIKAGKQINVVTDQFRSPTLAEDLACGCLLIAGSGATGVFHISGPDTYSIFDLAKMICEVFELPKDGIQPMESSILNQPAKRPPKTGFIIEKAQRELGYHPMDFKSGVSFVKKQLEGKKPLFEVTRFKNER